MDNNEIITGQLKEVAGGTGTELKPIPDGKCVQCGRKEDIDYLSAHGGRCRICANRKQYTKCPYCGGKLNLAQGVYEVGGPAVFICEACGKTVKV
jgi:hypothetical protein